MPKFVKQQTFHGGFHLVGYYRGSSNVALGNPFQTRDFPQVVVAPPPGEGKSTTVLWGIAAHGFDWAEGPTGPVQVYARVKNVAQCRSLVDYARSSPLAKNITANAQIAYDHIPEGQGSLLHPVAVACTYTTKGSLMRPVVAAARKWAKSQVPIVLALDKAQGILAGANRLKALLVLVRKLIRAADSGHDRKSLGSAYRRDLCRRFFFRENQILSSFIYIYFVDVSTYIGVFAKNISTNRGLN